MEGHEGTKAAEHVLTHGTPKHKAAAKAAGYTDGKDGDKEKAGKDGKKELREMHIKRGAKGGFIAKHDHHQNPEGPFVDADEYPISDIDHLHRHIDEHFGEGGGNTSEGEKEAQVEREADSAHAGAEEEASAEA